MTNPSKLKLAFFLALSVAQAALGREFFVRPTVAYVSNNTSGYDSAVAPGLAAGIYLGGKNQHEISFNALFPKFNFDDTFQGVREYGSEKFTPLLLDYKYHAVGVDQYVKNVDYYFGGSAGFARTKLSITATNGFAYIGGSDQDTVFSYGASTGFIIKLPHRFDIDLGYRFIRFSKQSYVIANIPLEGDDSQAHVIYAGVGYRF